MKWYKHISDSLDDPFIFGLMNEFGADGYLVFFGTLEVYSREFQPKDDWILTEKLSYFRHKLLISCSRFKKILAKITKWDVSYNGEYVSIYIPKFKELLDESTLKKLREHGKSFRNGSGMVPKSEATEEDKEEDKEKPLGVYTDDFLAFWKAYPKRSGSKRAAYDNWKKLNGERPEISVILTAINDQAEWRENANGEFRPEWKDPERWIKNRMWEAETGTVAQPKGKHKPPHLPTPEEEEAEFNQRWEKEHGKESQ